MDQTLMALGWRATPLRRVMFVLLIAGVTLGLMGSSKLVEDLLGVPALSFHCFLWIVWLTWLGYVFPLDIARAKSSGRGAPFRHAFYRNVLFGVSCSFAQMLRPAFHGIVEGALSRPVYMRQQIGLVFIAAGSVVIGLAMEVLGIHGAIFLQEYQQSPRLSRNGVYGVIRHPLFFGGIITSVGAALVLSSTDGNAMALANLTVLPAYLVLEDRRCCVLFGGQYNEYRAAVGAFAPKAVLVRRLLLSPEIRMLG